MDRIDLHYLGHASFLLRCPGAPSVLVDYGESNPYGMDSPVHSLGSFAPGIAAFTHSHPDHDRGLDFPGALVLRGTGLDAGGLRIRAFPSFENSAGDNSGYLFLFGGVSIVHAGDCQGALAGEGREGLLASIAKLCPRGIDLLLLPVGWTKDIVAEAASFALELEPRRLVPMHYWARREKTGFLEAIAAADHYRVEATDGPSISIPLAASAEDPKVAYDLKPGAWEV